MELLIVKTGTDYVRFKDGNYLLVGIDKASVFPMAQLEVVQIRVSELREHGLADVCIKKLVLSEEDL